jgi:hypothetical protein
MIKMRKDMRTMKMREDLRKKCKKRSLSNELSMFSK